MDTCRMARAREAAGGDVRATRMASRAAAFQSVTTSADADPPRAVMNNVAPRILPCFMRPSFPVYGPRERSDFFGGAAGATFAERQRIRAQKTLVDQGPRTKDGPSTMSQGLRTAATQKRKLL